jgi:hypothetical protein
MHRKWDWNGTWMINNRQRRVQAVGLMHVYLRTSQTNAPFIQRPMRKLYGSLMKVFVEEGSKRMFLCMTLVSRVYCRLVQTVSSQFHGKRLVAIKY